MDTPNLGVVADARLGVLIPTRNSMAYLPRHVEALNRWIELASEVVVVDSASKDGTAEYLKSQLRHSNIRFLQHPPGLYQSWNHGITTINSEFTYIATVGDVISRDGAQCLVAAIKEDGCDVVVSSPRMLDASGRRVRENWPVHALIDRYGMAEPRSLTGLEVFVWAAAHVYGSLLGSSASNIYRTEFLKSRPFPTDYGHAGDSAWAISNSFDLRMTILPETFSEFIVHPKPKGAIPIIGESLGVRLIRLARETYYKIVASGRADWVVADWTVRLEQFWEAYCEINNAKEQYTQLRRKHTAWILYPSVWTARAKRNRLRTTAGRKREELIHAILPPKVG